MDKVATFAPIVYISMLVLSIFGAVSQSASDGSTNDRPYMRADIDRLKRLQTLSQTWPQIPDYSTSFVALFPNRQAGEANSAYAEYDPSDDYWGLPRTGPHAYVAGVCGGCHTLEIVMQQRASRAQWAYMLDWMTQTQGMPALADTDHDLILSYLADHFGVAP